SGSITGTGTLTGSSYTVTNTSGTATIDAKLAGTGGLTKSGNGILALTNTNTYTGVTTINAGVLSVTSLANGNSNSGIGASNNNANRLIINGGTLRYSGTSNASTNRRFTLGTNG